MNHRPLQQTGGTGGRGFFIVLLAIFLLAVPGHAQTELEDLPIIVTGANWSVRPRTGGLVTLDLFVENRTQNIMRGSLHLIEAEMFSQSPLQLVLPDLTIRPGKQQYVVTLPPVSRMAIGGITEIVTELHTESGRLQLNVFSIGVPAYQQRALSMAISSPWIGQYLPYDELVSKLRLDRYEFVGLKDDDLICTPAYLATVGLPTEAAMYCNFDVLLLLAEGFTNLNAAQLDAIKTWVKAGGSLYIHSEQPLYDLSADHLAFLKDVFDEKVDVADPPALLLHRTGLGVVGITHETQPNETAIRQLTAHLWRLRHELKASFIETGEVPAAESEPSVIRALGPGADIRHSSDLDRDMYESLSIDDPPAFSSAWQVLLPQNVQMVPLWVIVVLLASLVFVIGPGDYIFLGLIRRRHYTWISLPIAVIATTWLFVAISNSYLGKSTSTRAVHLIDYDHEGSILRTNSFQQIFSGGAFELQQKMQGDLLVQMGKVSADQIRHNYWRAGGIYVDQVAGAAYEGTLPARASVKTQIQQWSPVMQRRTSLGKTGTLPKHQVDFSSVEPTELRSEQSRHDLARRLLKEFSATGSHSSQLLMLSAQEGLFALMDNGHVELSPAYTAVEFADTDSLDMGYLKLRRMFADVPHFVEQTSTRERFGWFKYVSKVSPMGSNTIEDLPLLDSTDPDQWLVIYLESREDDLYIHRAIYHLPEEEK